MEGLVFHFLQGFWYQFLVDAKIYQTEKYAREKAVPIKVAIREVLGMDIETWLPIWEIERENIAFYNLVYNRSLPLSLNEDNSWPLL
jgi:hypothetical protein